MTSIRCFMVEPAGRERLSLRRFTYGKSGATQFGCDSGYHNASAVIGEEPHTDQPMGTSRQARALYPDDSRWPSACALCGRAFEDVDEWQVFREFIWRKPFTGEEWTQRDLPIGAMYDAFWYAKNDRDGVGPDGMALHVVLPPGRGWGKVDA
jgi:hypothetical protein